MDINSLRIELDKLNKEKQEIEKMMHSRTNKSYKQTLRYMLYINSLKIRNTELKMQEASV